MHPAINPLVLGMKESATLAINLKALELRSKGKEIFHFGFGQSPFPVPAVIITRNRHHRHPVDHVDHRNHRKKKQSHF